MLDLEVVRAVVAKALGDATPPESVLVDDSHRWTRDGDGKSRRQ